MLSYLAGFFDGEGCAHVAFREYQGKRKRSVYVTRSLVVSNNSREACELFAATLGGSVYNTRSGHYQWRVNNREAIEAGTRLLPYLKLKTPQVQQMIEGIKVSQLWTGVNVDSDNDSYGK